MTSLISNVNFFIGALKKKKKIDGVGHVDNRPSTDKLHHFIQQKKMWHVTCDMWHMARDRMGGGC